MKLLFCFPFEFAHTHIGADLSVRHINDPVSKRLQPFKTMLCNNDSAAVSFPSRNNIHQFSYAFIIQIRRRLVHHKDFRMQRRYRSTGNLLLFSARKFKQAPVQQTVKIEIVDCFIQILLYLFFRHTNVFTAKNNLRISIHCIKLRFGILKNRAYKWGQLIKLRTGNILSAYCYFAGKTALKEMRN